MRELKSYRRVRLSVVRETAAAPYAAPRVIRCGADAAELLRAVIGDDPREVFAALYLDGRHAPLAVHACSVGTATETIVHPREVFGPALMLSAKAVIVAHNHPSGDPAPSSQDRTVTDRLQEAATLLGVELLDHLVIGAERFFTFTDCETQDLRP